MSHIDERLVADDDLAEIAIQSLEFCEVADPEPLVKALALWLIGEWRHHAATGGTHCDWAVQNLLVTATDLGWYRGAAAERKWAANASSMRGKHAADALHEEDRRKKQEALAMYRSRTWPSKAEAARTIAYHFGITEQTALRWVREFSRALT